MFAMIGFMTAFAICVFVILAGFMGLFTIRSVDGSIFDQFIMFIIGIIGIFGLYETVINSPFTITFHML